MCIKRVIARLPSLYEPAVSLSLLLTLSRLEEHAVSLPKQDTVSSLLFEEDQTNSFMEPVQLLEYIAKALKEVVKKLGHTHSLDSDVCTVNTGHLWLMNVTDCKKLMTRKILNEVLA